MTRPTLKQIIFRHLSALARDIADVLANTALDGARDAPVTAAPLPSVSMGTAPVTCEDVEKLAELRRLADEADRRGAAREARRLHEQELLWAVRTATVETISSTVLDILRERQRRHVLRPLTLGDLVTARPVVGPQFPPGAGYQTPRVGKVSETKNDRYAHFRSHMNGALPLRPDFVVSDVSAPTDAWRARHEFRQAEEVRKGTADPLPVLTEFDKTRRDAVRDVRRLQDRKLLRAVQQASLDGYQTPAKNDRQAHFRSHMNGSFSATPEPKAPSNHFQCSEWTDEHGLEVRRRDMLRGVAERAATDGAIVEDLPPGWPMTDAPVPAEKRTTEDVKP